MRLHLISASALLLAAACAEQSNNRVSPRRDPATASQPGSAVTGEGAAEDAGAGEGGGLGDLSGLKIPEGTFLKAVYNLKIRALNGTEVCSNTEGIQFELYSNLTFGIVKGKVNCMSMCEVDVAALVKPLTADVVGKIKLDMSNKKGDPVGRLTELNGATFTPSRPLFLSPFLLKLEEYDGLAVNEQVRITAPDSNGSGQVGVRVVSTDEVIQPPGFPKPFTRTLRWRMESSGFEGVKRAKYALIDSLEVAFGLQPFGVPEVKARTALKTIIDPNDKLDGEQIKNAAKLCKGLLGDLGTTFGDTLADVGNGLGDGPFGGIVDSIKQALGSTQVEVELTLAEQEGI